MLLLIIGTGWGIKHIMFPAQITLHLYFISINLRCLSEIPKNSIYFRTIPIELTRSTKKTCETVIRIANKDSFFFFLSFLYDDYLLFFIFLCHVRYERLSFRLFFSVSLLFATILARGIFGILNKQYHEIEIIMK